MAIVFSIIGGMFGLIGALTGLVVKILPVAILIGIGILIGRSLNSRGSTGSDLRHQAQDAIDGFRTRAQDLYHGSRSNEQEIIDANGRVIR
jgi:hypothetical protein